MKVNIKAESQLELDLKKADLIKKIAGSTFDINIEKAMKMKKGQVKAQDQISSYWHQVFDEEMAGLKKDIAKILRETK